eukprot:CAMPEP_0184333804 /NCGR_PEP_ID=MMETSP1089-20130417/2769_1 /TAXON_ID=38269 ORGANISM="Gloeochaete wittrockiana, Strain SAG46.84" /NCGR_SAMPLE_ID=MMETSP1089 /ASSEMBLY_ACC=CAM_ASM_000445 /LENGTH=91 /DNA_ID=CAMNT_0026657839 /DNA_START=308 /DNA_END=579 /DNA_ORIENTATION=+
MAKHPISVLFPALILLFVCAAFACADKEDDAVVRLRGYNVGEVDVKYERDSPLTRDDGDDDDDDDDKETETPSPIQSRSPATRTRSPATRT